MFSHSETDSGILGKSVVKKAITHLLSTLTLFACGPVGPTEAEVAECVRKNTETRYG